MPLTTHSLSRAILLASVVAGTGACARTVQAWPPPITPGISVHVRFAAPRLVVFERGITRDSVAGMRELRGNVFALRGDTLVLSMSTGRSGKAIESEMSEGRTTIVLDRSTIVTLAAVDGWKLAYGLLAGCVVIFVALVLSGS